MVKKLASPLALSIMNGICSICWAIVAVFSDKFMLKFIAVVLLMLYAFLTFVQIKKVSANRRTHNSEAAETKTD